MTDTERKIFTHSELIEEFPKLEEWFADPKNRSAQLQEEKRLMSVAEKLVLFGGEKQIRGNLTVVTRSWRSSYIVLLACRQEPMIPFEIYKFGDAIERRFHAASIFETISELMDQGNLTRIQDLMYITYSGSNRFELNKNRIGYLTTEEGLRQIALQLKRKSDKELVRGLIPDQN